MKSRNNDVFEKLIAKDVANPNNAFIRFKIVMKDKSINHFKDKHLYSEFMEIHYEQVSIVYLIVFQGFDRLRFIIYETEGK